MLARIAEIYFRKATNLIIRFSAVIITLLGSIRQLQNQIFASLPDFEYKDLRRCAKPTSQGIMTNASPATGFPASSTTRPEKLALSISIVSLQPSKAQIVIARQSTTILCKRFRKFTGASPFSVGGLPNIVLVGNG